MGVFDRAKQVSGLSKREEDEDSAQYVCLACETSFDVQHHTCPACGSFDIRHAKWIQE